MHVLEPSTAFQKSIEYASWSKFQYLKELPMALVSSRVAGRPIKTNAIAQDFPRIVNGPGSVLFCSVPISLRPEAGCANPLVVDRSSRGCEKLCERLLTVQDTRSSFCMGHKGFYKCDTVHNIRLLAKHFIRFGVRTVCSHCPIHSVRVSYSYVHCSF